MSEMTREQIALSDEIIAEVRAEMEAEERTLKAAQDRADREMAEEINAHLPCRVQVVRSDTDREASGYRCDEGRIGWVRTRIEFASAYVVDLSPGDDGNPSRLHSPRHLKRVPVSGQTGDPK
jgi:hypothetical protein